MACDLLENIRTIDDVVYNTFREACVAMGLTHNNQEWVDIFTKAVTFASGEL